MRMHPLAEGVVDAYLSTIDAEIPRLVEGLYLTGSVALGDFRPHTSDVDFVAVTANQLNASAIAALQRVHGRLRTAWPQPHFDGRYVTWDQLAHDPAVASQCPHSYEGRVHACSRIPGDPVTWHTVAYSGIPCRGPKPTDVNIWADAEGLAVWTLNNLESYWRRLFDCSSRFLHRRSLIALTSYGTVWIVLGVSRLHYTLATGRICSKEDAGLYALQTFPEQWHRIVHESLRIRRGDWARPDLASAFADVTDSLRTSRTADRGSRYPTLQARRRDVLSFCDMVITDAFRRYGSRAASQPQL